MATPEVRVNPDLVKPAVAVPVDPLDGGDKGRYLTF